MELDFYEALKSRGLYDLLKPVEYKPQLFSNYEKMKDMFNDIAFNPDSSILIYGDYDLDGLMFVTATKDFCDALTCSNYTIFPYWRRTHELDREAVRYCIQNKFEYFIIGDTASSDLSILQELVSYGVKVIVIDHHVCNYEYSDFGDNIAIVNSFIENRIVGYKKYAYSAAALAYVIYDYYAQEHGIDYKKATSAYALISLYSDCMDMSNELNRALYYRACSVGKENLPSRVLHFINEYQSFNSRFISFWYAPRINSLFRGENFQLINSYFFDQSLDAAAIARCIEDINKFYTDNRRAVQQLTDLIDVTEYEHFVVADLATATEKCQLLLKNSYNYTGLIANKLSERYRKTAVVYGLHNNHYKGSVRDLYGKNYLNTFQQICYAAGHNSAFGLKINLLDLDYFLERIERIDARYSIVDIPNEPLIIKHEYSEPDNLMIEDMALYNEFSGNTIPTAYVFKQLIGAMRETKTAYYYRYDWGQDYFVQNDYSIDLGTKMIVKPVKSGRTKLFYQG